MKFRYLLLSIALAWSSILQAQTQTRPLTNRDVVEMVKAGLAETVIINAIQSSPANYDCSVSALIDLQKANVSAKIQEAMQSAQRPKGPKPAVSGLNISTRPFGVFLEQGQERIEMKQNKGEYDVIAAPFFSKVFIKFEGRQADFRVSSSTPVFEVALPGDWVPAERVKLVKPDVAKERRELLVQGMAGPGVQVKPNKKANVSLKFEDLGAIDSSASGLRKHRIRPEKPLAAGEYVLIVESTYYCFGVDAGR